MFIFLEKKFSKTKHLQLYVGGIKMNKSHKLKNLDEKSIINKLIKLIEHQEKIKITYKLIEKG